MDSKQFEYRLEGCETTPYGMVMLSDTETLLNDLGQEGWELVSVSDKIMYFKREIKNG